MMEYLATLLPPGARVASIGGPDVTDDIELMLGIVHGLALVGLVLVNDPEDPRYKNITDVRSGGYEMTANLLADFADLDGLVPYNDETALGAIEALTEAGRLGEVKMVSRNGTPNLVELIRAGVHHGTWDIDTIGIGRATAELVIRASSTARSWTGCASPARSAGSSARSGSHRGSPGRNKLPTVRYDRRPSSHDLGRHHVAGPGCKVRRTIAEPAG